MDIRSSDVAPVCVTCSETRAAHKLSAKLMREIIIGGSSLNTPAQFLEQLKVCFNGPQVSGPA